MQEEFDPYAVSEEILNSDSDSQELAIDPFADTPEPLGERNQAKDSSDFSFEDKDEEEDIQNEEPSNEDAEEEDDLFSDKKPEKSKFDDISDDELKELLKKRNISFEEKPDEEEFAQEKEEIKINQKYISDVVDFVKQSDEAIIESKERENLIKKYRSEGKDINSSDFRYDLDDIMGDFKRSPSIMKSHADSIRDRVINEAHRRKDSIEKTQAKIDKTLEQRKIEKEEKVKNAFRQIRSSQFYGIDVSDDEYRKAQKNLADGSLAREIMNNPTLAAEVALFQLKRKEFSEKLDGPTYGEGVKDALQRFTPEDARPSSTQRVMSKGDRSAKIDGLTSRESFWSNDSKQDDKTEKYRNIIGYPM